MKKEALSQFICDYLPLGVFFLCYKFSQNSNHLLFATKCMIAATLISLVFAYVLTKKIAKMALFSGLLLGIFGGLTIFLKDDVFIKIKPTIINLLFATILFYGYFTNKPLLCHLFGAQIKINNQAWLTLSLRWGIFFIFLATLNEIIWRNSSTDFWVQFKVFGMTPISLVFAMSQLPFMLKEMKKNN